ncbi:MAG: hypothetical protein J6X84_07025 [Treponema sp.]|nr:hypothetical protein [Treponema sp.]
MEEKKTYSRASMNLIRFFCIIGIVVEVLCVIRLFLRSEFTLGFYEIKTAADFFTSDFCLFVIDSFSFLIFVILLFVPKNFVLFALVAFIYSFKIIAVETVSENPIGLLLYMLGVSCLIYKGVYRKFMGFKIFFTIFFYLGLVSFSFRFGLLCLINSLIITLGYGLTFLATLFFVVNFLKIIYVKRTARIWNLSQYPELTERDKEWLKQILDEKRYEEIAKESGITVGTLKNRMHQIYSIVGIEDRISLLATYGGYEVTF